jgi:tol-pal system protein YbgF
MKSLSRICSQGYRLGAISLIVVALLLSGCATKQDLLRVEDEVNQIRSDQKMLYARMSHIDSILVQGSEQDRGQRVQMQTAIQDLTAQLSQLQNQLTDMQQLVFKMSQRSGAGNTPTLAAPVTQTPVQPPMAADTTKAVSGDTAAQTGAPSVDCRQIWDQAFKDMRKGQYDLAISGFSDYLKFCPNGDLRDNSQYWIAEAYYETKKYEKAISEYNLLLTQYPDTEKKATAYFKIGRSYEEMNNRKKATEYYLKLKKEFPASLEYGQVKEKLEKWQKESKR